MIGLLISNRATTAITAAVVVWVTSTAYYKIENYYAVEAAVQGLVSEVQLEAAKAKANELERRAQLAEVATAELQQSIKELENQTVFMLAEIEKYEQSTVVDPDCTVSPDVVKRLRNR